MMFFTFPFFFAVFIFLSFFPAASRYFCIGPPPFFYRFNDIRVDLIFTYLWMRRSVASLSRFFLLSEKIPLFRPSLVNFPTARQVTPGPA